MKTVAFWIATTKYHREAAASLDSLLTYMPDIQTSLVTPESEQSTGPWNYIRPVPPVSSSDAWYLNSVSYWCKAVHDFKALGFKTALYLDTDVRVAGDLSPLLALLGRFDIVGAHATGKQTTPSAVETPDAFPEMAVGVNAFRLDDNTDRLFSEWERLYRFYPRVYGNNDQGPLRDALWVNPQIHPCFVTDEWHWQFRFGGRIRGVVHAFHGRSPNIEAIIARVNARPHELRAYGKKELT